jgi:hypothetical protein
MKIIKWLMLAFLFAVVSPMASAQTWQQVPINGSIKAGTWASGRGWNKIHAIGNGLFLIQDSMNPCGDPFSNALWEYDAVTNTFSLLYWSGGGAPSTGGNCPQPQVVVDPTVINMPGLGDRHPFGQNAYDTLRNVYWQIGGLEDQGNCAGTGKGSCAYPDTWGFNLLVSLWTRFSDMPKGMAAKEQAAAVYDPVADIIIYYGGTRGGQTDTNTWVFSPSLNTWTKVATVGPPARLYQTMFYDAQRGHAVLYGGQLSNGTPLSDMWIFDSATNVWTEVVQGGTLPPANRFPPMAMNTTDGLYYYYDGPNATYIFDPDAQVWSLTAIVGGPVINPNQQNSRSMDYDPLIGFVMKDISPGDAPQVLWTVQP